MIFDEINSNRCNDKLELNSRKNVQLDEELLFWMNIEDEYFGKVDSKLKEILKFHINSSEYILKTINETLNNEKNILTDNFSYHDSSYLIFNGGLDEWNKVNCNLNGDGYGLYDNNDTLYINNDHGSSINYNNDIKIDDKITYDNNNSKKIKNIRLTLSIPPLYKPSDFPKELNHCNNVRDILLTLFRLNCLNKYTPSNTNKNVRNINDKVNELLYRESTEFDKNKSFNYICILPDIITGPNIEYCCSDKTKDENVYNFNDISDNWIFNINNSELNLYLRKKLLDTSNIQFNNIKDDFITNNTKNDYDEGNIDNNNDLNKKKNLDCDNVSIFSSNIVKTIIGSEEYINNDKEGFIIDENKLISVIDDKNLGSNSDNVDSNKKIICDNKGGERIKKLKSFGDFFQDNINISPNMNNMLLYNENELNKSVYTNNNLNSIMNSNNKINFVSNNSNYFNYDDYNVNKSNETRNIYYLNRINNISLVDISKSLIKRLEEISMKKIKLFKVILDRIENERQIDIDYWVKKEYELNSYYRVKQCELNNYNYTLEKQSKDLEIYRLGCIESKYLPNEWQETAVCSICGNDTDWDEDPIYFCDGCYQPAHHSCVNPKQPFKYNSTRMLNVIEREKKCQQGDFNSENLNLKNKSEQDDDDQWWLCDSCLTIKSELLDHRYLFFLLIRMISGPRNSESYKQSRAYIQKNVDLFLSQLVNYNVLSSNVVTNNNKNIENNDKVIFPWINNWKFPLISENNSFCENDDGECNTNANNLTSERRKGRPRKTPLITPSKPKNNCHYFTFEFDNYFNKKDEYSTESNLYLFNDWIPSVEIPYNLADLDLFNKQIFNPIKWYTELNNKKKMNQTPPPIYIMTDNDNFQDKIDINDDKLISNNNNNNNNNNLFDIYENDSVIIEKLIEKRIIEYDSIYNKYKIHVKVPICQLCGYDSYSRGGGIMKKTVDGYWSHIRCALSNNSVLSNDGNYVRIKIDLHRNKIKCEGCNKIDSSPVLCHNNECCKYYHINCATSIKECIVDWESNKPIFYCPEHASYIAPTLLLRKYQLSNFNNWFYDKYYNNSLKYKHSIVKMNNSNFNDTTVTNKYNEGDKLSIFSNVFNLPIIIRQTFLADLRDDTQTVIFLAKLLKVLYNNNNNSNNSSTLDSNNINHTINNEINKCKNDINEPLFNSFSKFHLYLPELVYVKSIDTVISRLTTPWSGDVNFWLKVLNNNILNTLGINNIYNINQYKYINNSRLIITCIFNIMELLLNRLINPYEIRLITLIIASKMGFGPWFSLFYYWKFIPLTFYYNIIKNNDLSMLEPTSRYSINNSMQNYDNNTNSCNILSALDHKNVSYHLHLFGLKYLSIEKVNPSEAFLKSINSCYSIISKNWNYCCQICNSVYPIFDENINFGNVSNCHLYKCQVCNVVICFHCNNFYNIISIQNHDNGFTCQRCFYFKSKDYLNVVTDSCCCLCSRFDSILIRIQKGTYIDFRNIKSRKTLLSDGSIYLDEEYKLIDDVWVHPLCIEWLTAYSKDQSSLIYNIISLEKKYFNNLCKYCGLNSGIAIKCSHNSCNTYFHVSCGKSIGCKFDYSKYKNKQYDQFGNTNIHSGSYNNNNSNYCYQQQYRRSWCLFHNQYNNNSIIHNNNSNDNNNSNQHDLNHNYHNNKNYTGITSSGSQDVLLLRTLFNNIIENHKKINNNNLDNACYYSTSQNDNTILKISLLNYYGLNIFEDYNKNNKNSNLNNIGVYNSLLFSNDLQLKNNNINYQCGHDILYISKWEDLIQILCYDVITRFIYGIGFPKQKHINSSVNRNLNQNKKKLSCNNNQKQNFNEITKNNDISNNMCIACDKLYKRDWSLLYLDWIYCDTCNNWFHWCCLGLNKGNIPKDNEPYKCIFCSGFKKTRGRKRKTLINPLELNVANVLSYNNNQHKISHSNSNANLYIDESKNILFPHSISQNQMIESNLSSITNESDINNKNNIGNINYNNYKYTEGSHTQPQLVTNIGVSDNKEQLEFYTESRGGGDMLTSENHVSVCNSIKYSSQSQPSLPSPSSSSSSYSSSFSSPSRSSLASESS